jgi:hypothetical protein
MLRSTLSSLNPFSRRKLVDAQGSNAPLSSSAAAAAAAAGRGAEPEVDDVAISNRKNADTSAPRISAGAGAKGAAPFAGSAVTAAPVLDTHGPLLPRVAPTNRSALTTVVQCCMFLNDHLPASEAVPGVLRGSLDSYGVACAREIEARLGHEGRPRPSLHGCPAEAVASVLAATLSRMEPGLVGSDEFFRYQHAVERQTTVAAAGLDASFSPAAASAAATLVGALSPERAFALRLVLALGALLLQRGFKNVAFVLAPLCVASMRKLAEPSAEYPTGCVSLANGEAFRVLFATLTNDITGPSVFQPVLGRAEAALRVRELTSAIPSSLDQSSGEEILLPERPKSVPAGDDGEVDELPDMLSPVESLSSPALPSPPPLAWPAVPAPPRVAESRAVDFAALARAVNLDPALASDSPSRNGGDSRSSASSPVPDGPASPTATLSSGSRYRAGPAGSAAPATAAAIVGAAASAAAPLSAPQARGRAASGDLLGDSATSPSLVVATSGAAAPAPTPAMASVRPRASEVPAVALGTVAIAGVGLAAASKASPDRAQRNVNADAVSEREPSFFVSPAAVTSATVSPAMAPVVPQVVAPAAALTAAVATAAAAATSASAAKRVDDQADVESRLPNDRRTAVERLIVWYQSRLESAPNARNAYLWKREIAELRSELAILDGSPLVGEETTTTEAATRVAGTVISAVAALWDRSHQCSAETLMRKKSVSRQGTPRSPRSPKPEPDPYLDNPMAVLDDSDKLLGEVMAMAEQQCAAWRQQGVLAGADEQGGGSLRPPAAMPAVAAGTDQAVAAGTDQARVAVALLTGLLRENIALRIELNEFQREVVQRTQEKANEFEMLRSRQQQMQQNEQVQRANGSGNGIHHDRQRKLKTSSNSTWGSFASMISE